MLWSHCWPSSPNIVFFALRAFLPLRELTVPLDMSLLHAYHATCNVCTHPITTIRLQENIWHTHYYLYIMPASWWRKKFSICRVDICTNCSTSISNENTYNSLWIITSSHIARDELSQHARVHLRRGWNSQCSAPYTISCRTHDLDLIQETSVAALQTLQLIFTR